MRTFTDSAGIEWTVFEVKRKESAQQWTYLPHAYGNGWLCFESVDQKRRLTPIPDLWRKADDRELEELLRHARPVARSRTVAGEDTLGEAR